MVTSYHRRTKTQLHRTASSAHERHRIMIRAYRVACDKLHYAHQKLANTAVEDHKGDHHVADLDAASFDTHTADKEDPCRTCWRSARRSDDDTCVSQTEQSQWRRICQLSMIHWQLWLRVVHWMASSCSRALKVLRSFEMAAFLVRIV